MYFYMLNQRDDPLGVPNRQCRICVRQRIAPEAQRYVLPPECEGVAPGLISKLCLFRSIPEAYGELATLASEWRPENPMAMLTSRHGQTEETYCSI